MGGAHWNLLSKQEWLEEYFLLVSEGEGKSDTLINPFRYQSFGFSERCFEGKSLY